MPIRIKLLWRSCGALLLAFAPVPGVLAAAPVPAPAGTESILFGEIPSVFGASKYEQRLEEAPASVSIVTAEEIKRYGYRTLADILRSVRGMYVTYDRNYSYLGVRGFSRPTDYNSRVLLMIDGHRTNENIFHMALIGTEGLIDVDLIDRVEVIRGPGSSIYGASALFAVVNIITKRGRDYQTTEVSAEAGSLETIKGRVTYGSRKVGDTEVLVSASGYGSQGNKRLYYPEFDNPADNNGIAEDLDSDRARSGFMKFSRGDVTVTGAYVERNKAVPTASFDAVFNQPFQETIDRHGYLDVFYDTALSNNDRFTARLAFDSYRYNGYYASAYLMPGGVLARDYGYGQWWTGEVQYMTRLADRHRLIVGAEHQSNIRQDQAYWELDPYVLGFRNDRSSRRWAVFAQDEWRLHRDLLLYAGARYDHYSEWGGATNPRLALVHQLSPRTTAKLLYGQAFRAPSPYEFYYTPSPWLRPETSNTTELVFEHQLRRNLRAAASLYYYLVNDLIDQQPDFTFRNVGNAEATGVELDLDGRFASWLEGRLSYSYQQVRDETTNTPLSNSPHHLVKLNLNTPLLDNRLVAGFEVQYVSDRRTLSGAVIDGYTLVNFTLLGRRWIKGMEFSASVYNLLDQRYADPAGIEHFMDVIPQDGRGFRVKVQYEF